MLLKGNGYNVSKKLKRFINCTFVWWEDKARKKPYPLTPLVSEGEVLSDSVLTNYDGEPLPLFIIYKNGTCGIEVTRGLSTRTDIELAVGGITLIPGIDFTGYQSRNINSLSYATERIAIGYNDKTNKVVLIGCKKDLTIYEFKTMIEPLKFKYVLGLDSGGSAQWVFDKSKRLTSRNMIGWLYY